MHVIVCKMLLLNLVSFNLLSDQTREHQFKRHCLGLPSFFLKFFKVRQHEQMMGKGTFSPSMSLSALFGDNICSGFPCLMMIQE